MRLIDADDLKKDLRQYFTDGVLDGVSAKLVFNQILHDIDNAPTVESDYEWGYSEGVHDTERPQGEWIPVSEKLPERNKEVIVTDIETKDTYCSWYHGKGYWECDNGVLKNRIIAWQPLPEPYKKGGAE